MRYITKDGEPLDGGSPLEIVTQLRDCGRFTAGQDLDEFMEGYAQRLLEYSGHQVRTDDIGLFLTDLVAVGELLPR